MDKAVTPASPQIDEMTMLMTPIQSIDHLQAWCSKFLGFTLPDCKVTAKADSTPADFVYEIYRAVMDGKPLNILGLSGRDSSKTVALSVADLLVMLHDQRGGIHAAMTKVQASRARDYLQTYIYKIPVLKSAILKENNSTIQLSVGGQEVGLELISLTPKAVQGAHAAWVSVDELASSMDPQQIKAYRDLSGVPGTHKLNGKPAVIVKITSRQNGASLAEQEIKNAQKSGIKVVTWTTIDCMKKCTPDRHGTTVVPMNINIVKGLAYNDAEFAALDEVEKDGFERTEETTDGCLRCPLLQFCQGKAKKQTSESILLRSIEDVIGKVQAAGSHDWVLSQLMSLKPSSEGLVYFEFNRNVHMPGWDAMWERLTGETSDVPVTRKMFISKAKKLGVVFYAGIDWGWSAPSTCVVIGVDSKENIYVVEALGKVGLSDPEFVDFVRTHVHPIYDIQMYAPDSAQPGSIKYMRSVNLPAAEIDKSAGTVREGINVVKRFLKIPGTNNSTKLMIAPDIISSITSVPGLVDEFEMYKKETDATGRILDDKNPVPENDHYLDALRYILFWIFAKATGQVVFSDPMGTKYGKQPHAYMPMEEIAAASGVNFNDNRSDFEHLGKQDSDKKDPDDDGTPPPSGGLSFGWT